jgi:hypothetical protein
MDVVSGGAPQSMSRRHVELGEKRLQLNTAKNARKSLSRLIREYYAAPANKADVVRFRACAYGIRMLLDFFAFEQQGDLIERLEKIEEAESVRQLN